METKVIRFEIKFTHATLTMLLGLILLTGLGVALVQGQEPPGGTGGEKETVIGGGIASQSTLDDGFWYQGRLTDGSGNPLANTSIAVTARIYSALSGGTALDSTTITIETDENGLFNNEIDFNNPDLFDGRALYLGLWVDGEASEMTPRQCLRTVPYAMSIRPGAVISTNTSYDPVLEIHNNYSSTYDLDGLKVYSESGGEAVEGRSKRGKGIYGSTDANGRTNDAGVYGYAHRDAPGVRGHSAGDANNSYGGYFTSSNYRGLYAKGGNGYYAAYFESGGGSSDVGIYVYGDIAASGDKTAIVSTENYGARKMYSMESPGVWFEDFGQSKLTNGQATVVIEPMFRSTINTDKTYYVFLTPLGNCNGLYVTNKTTSSFEVRELSGGTANVTFDYRIVAVRKGYEQVRMEPFTESGKPMAVNIPVASSAVPEPEDP